MNDSKYKDLDIWDLKYISTSDEEDNDSDIASDGEESEESEENEDEHEEDVYNKVFDKNAQGKKVPHIWKKLKHIKRSKERQMLEV